MNSITYRTSAIGCLFGTMALALLGSASSLLAWDHPGHMTTAAIAFNEIKRERPELIEKLSGILMSHPNPSSFAVAIGDTRGEERARRLLIFAARWPDDSKFTFWDKPTWHTARWPILAEDATPEAKAEAERRGDQPAGQALKAADLNFAVMSNSEANVKDLAMALCWVFHIVGDIHQPLHCSDYYSKEFPTGNGAGTMSYVVDPFPGADSSIPLHLLWDSNTLRSTELEDVYENAEQLAKKYPRSEFPELKTDTIEPGIFEKWARESYQVAADFAYQGIETVPDPAKDQDSDALMANMVKFIREGVSPVPVAEAPKVPAEYWETLQDTAHRRITLAGYRMADLIFAAADQITAEREFIGR